MPHSPIDYHVKEKNVKAVRHTPPERQYLTSRDAAAAGVAREPRTARWSSSYITQESKEQHLPPYTASSSRQHKAPQHLE